MKFGQLILRKVIQIVATRCHILRLKMNQIRYRLGLCPRPRRGSIEHSPGPLAGFKGPTSKRRGGQKKGKEGKEGGKRRRKKGEG